MVVGIEGWYVVFSIGVQGFVGGDVFIDVF